MRYIATTDLLRVITKRVRFLGPQHSGLKNIDFHSQCASDMLYCAMKVCREPGKKRTYVPSVDEGGNRKRGRGANCRLLLMGAGDSDLVVPPHIPFHLVLVPLSMQSDFENWLNGSKPFS